MPASLDASSSPPSTPELLISTSSGWRRAARATSSSLKSSASGREKIQVPPESRPVWCARIVSSLSAPSGCSTVL
ncbi:hypothetical protein D7I44_04020 [Gryllotalpicola protaetiae]|uniref:Uncharacterized protein n=1 Tax=Gryllotalpicola protaetiae TaxID=2419771 RepID=A0A387BP23_9MICO|nr:hypothetical protein D7I44_04020 [Gryllotalpicola protaetiae]